VSRKTKVKKKQRKNERRKETKSKATALQYNTGSTKKNMKNDKKRIFIHVTSTKKNYMEKYFITMWSKENPSNLVRLIISNPI
jgi:uncharacterized membrane protein YhiD involved in acid resistance